jgi:uncharacterized metal-binding protein YceD (DUF177 family)
MSSKYLRYFNIDIFNLANKDYQYEFEFDEQLFAAFSDTPFQKGKGVCKVALKKSETMMVLTFDIVGSVALICDRSLEEFDYPLDFEEKMILKFGEEDVEVSESMAIIHRDSQQINMGQFIYEFIMLDIPMKKLHPKFKKDEEDDDEEDDSLIYSSDDSDEEDDDESNDNDPRWDILKKLK